MKTFKEFLSENPTINTYWNKDRLRSDISNKVRSQIKSDPDKHKSIGGDYYAHKQDNNHVYFRKHGSDVKEPDIMI